MKGSIEMRQKNSPALWSGCFPLPSAKGHKYDRGHAVVFGSAELTGASRLAAEGASRIGAGLVSLVADGNEDIYRQTLSADIMVRREFSQINKPGVVLAGSGGIGKKRREEIEALLLQNVPMVLDAEMLDDKLDWSLLSANCVLTPHSGEFQRLFPDMNLEKILEEQIYDLDDIAQLAAEETGAVLVLKGPVTFIAHPDGRVVINDHASPYLAKAGTGDVLAGMITGLMAQGMPAFEAACAAVWLHGEAGLKIGPGLVASDIPSTLRLVLKEYIARWFRAR